MTWICVVDGDADARDEITEALKQRGYRVSAFADGADALRAIDTTTEPPGLVLLDLFLSNLSGPEVLQHLRSNARVASTPVLLMTGFDVDEALLVPEDAANLLRKPVTLDLLMDRITQVLGPPR